MVLSMKVLLKCDGTATLHAKLSIPPQIEHEAFYVTV